MNFLRILTKLLVVVLLLVALGIGLGFVPDVQTWLAEFALGPHANPKVSLGSVWARFGKMDAEDVRVDFPGGVLTLPSIHSELPLIHAARGQVTFRRLVAKGWTLDFRPPPPAPVTPADASPPSSAEASDGSVAVPTSAQPTSTAADAATRAFKGLLSSWKLPWDFSADAVDLEGDVLFPATADAEGGHFHVTITGGGVGAGRKSALTLVADGAFPAANISSMNAKGELLVTMKSPRTFDVVEWKPALSATVGPPAKKFDAKFDLQVARDSAGDNYRADLLDENRHLATIVAHFREDSFAGTWQTDLRKADLLPLFHETPLPFAMGHGHGNFEVDRGLARLHLTGEMRVDLEHRDPTASSVRPLRNAALDTQFDLVRVGDTVRVNRLSATLGGTRPLASAHALQPFEFNTQTGAITPSAPTTDWIDGAIERLPLSTFSGLTGAWQLTGGELSGPFAVQLLDGGFSVRGKKSVTVAHLTLQHDGVDFARGLDVSVAFTAESNSKGWQVHGTPLVVSRAGKTGATVELSVSRPSDPDFPWTIETKGKADLAELSAQPGLAKAGEFAVSAVAGNVVTTIGQWIHFAGDVTLTEHSAGRTVSAQLNADLRDDNSVAFRVPLTLTDGATVTELSTEGKWLHGKYGHEISANIASKNLDVDSLRALAPLLAPLVRVEADQLIPTSQFGQPKKGNDSPDTRDRAPFWGDAFGHVTFSVETLKLGGSELKDVHGTLKVDAKSFQLEHTLYQLANHLAAADAAISFDAAADERYRVTGTFDDGEIDAEPLFGPPAAGEDPPFHGRFTVASTLKGEGNTIDDLYAKTQQQFRLKSTGGIVRLFKTHVAGVTQQKESKIADAAGVVGDLFGKVAGVQKNSISTGQIKLNKNTDAVLNFSYDCGEIGYSELTLTAARGIDGTLHVLELSLVSPDVHLTGKGEVAYVKGVSPVKAPLNAEFRFAVRDTTANQLAETGLLSAEKDSLGYTLFNRSFRVAGTLQHPDVTQWHDLLLDAAVKSADARKK